MYKALGFYGGQTANGHLGAQHRQDDRHRAMRYVVGFPGVRIWVQPQQLVLSAIVRELSPLLTIKGPRIGGIRHAPTLIQHRPEVGWLPGNCQGRFGWFRSWLVPGSSEILHQAVAACGFARPLVSLLWSKGVKYVPLGPFAAAGSAPGAYKRIRTGPPAGLGLEIHRCGLNSPNPAVVCPPRVFA